jgi:starch-binding outer membrane protein, SusD/RagB family
MRQINIKTLIGTLALTLFLMACSKSILDEQPRSSFTPEFFKTQAGVMGGVTSLYSNLRNMYGQAYYYNSLETGTDEATYGQSADANFKDADLSGVGTVSSTSMRSDVLWNNVFPNINTASGIIENATAVNVAKAGTKDTIAKSLIAEAQFMRAFDYFLLVQTFGGVPLDLGSGELKFNITPVRVSTRNTVPQVYTKAIFPDLLTAINNLPSASRLTGTLTRNVARLFLAKAYLTYGWWLQNPNNIPTYPTSDRTDPNGKTAANYFQMAYDMATTAISTPGSYGLQPTFYDVNVGSNDRNNECMLYADHTQASEQYNVSSLSYGGGGAPDNFVSWMLTWNYTNLRSSGVSSVQREAAQALGRPWVRMAPTVGVFLNTFADKTNDSRYDGTFTTTYRANWPKGGLTQTSLVNANSMSIVPGDAVLSFLDTDNPSIVYPGTGTAGISNVGAGVLPGRADYVVGPSGISRLMFPGIWKLGPYRTDNGTGLGSGVNAGSTRPYVIAKFSEFFFIAAEAAVKGATTTAVTGTYANDGTAKGLINVIRARAGKWRFNNNGNVAKVADNSAAMVAATPATIDINYILAERSREYYGEGYRWFDLVRTQTWAAIAGTYQICGTSNGDHTLVTVTRTIPNNYYLRPIPQGQLDGMDMSTANKAAYQNPGY